MFFSKAMQRYGLFLKLQIFSKLFLFLKNFLHFALLSNTKFVTLCYLK